MSAHLPFLPQQLPPLCQHRHSGRPHEAVWQLAVEFVPSSDSATHHRKQMLLLAASATEICAGLKQSHDSWLPRGAELLSHHTSASLAFHCAVASQAHTHSCQLARHWSQRQLETDCTEGSKEERTPINCPKAEGRLVLWLDGDFVDFFALLIWEATFFLGLHRSSPATLEFVPCILTLELQTRDPEITLHLLKN